MFKWFLATVGLALVVAFTLWQRDAVKTSYVNGLAQYNRLPGREYIFERDCYIFKFSDRARDTSYPLVGAHATVPELPAEVAGAKIGAALPGVRLLDIVRTGARFKIISVRRDESRRGTSVTFEILFMDEAERKYPRLDAYWLLDHAPEKDGEAPRIREDYAVARVK
jgi:hypothetical protein